MPTGFWVMICGVRADLSRHVFGLTQLVSPNKADNSRNQSFKTPLWFNICRYIIKIKLNDLISAVMPLDWFIDWNAAMRANAF